MKLLVALLFALSSASLAQTGADPQSAIFSLNQANVAISLEQKDFETIYRTDQVPDTCYRDEVQGTRTACHTEYDRQCHTESYPSCTNIPRRVCHSSEQCSNVPDKVCNSHGCTSISRRVCHPVQSCSTTSDRVCHTDNRSVCHDVPRQACAQVPNVVKVPYSCTRPVQVPIGQQLKLHTVAQVAVNLVNFADVGATSDILAAKLVDGQVSITVLNQASNAFLYQVVNQQRTEEMLSPTEKLVKYTISVSATSIQKLNAFLNSEISNPKLHYDRLEFSLNGTLNVPFKGHLKILQYRRFRSALVMIDDDFGAAAVVGQSAIENILFNNFGVVSLNDADHSIELSLQVDTAQLQKGLLNPAAIVQVATKAVLSSFEAYPVQ